MAIKMSNNINEIQSVQNKAILFNGTQVNYFILCKSKLWLFSHFVQMEKNSDMVKQGKILHEQRFGKEKKDIQIDSKIAFDFVKKGNLLEIHEVKKSSKLENAHKMQLLYYLYYLKKEKDLNAVGLLHYPKENKKVSIELTQENEKDLENVLIELKQIVEQQLPPIPIKKPYCRKCSYFEFCWI